MLFGLAEAHLGSADFANAVRYCDAVIAKTHGGRRGWGDRIHNLMMLMNGYMSVGALPVRPSTPPVATPVSGRRIYLTVLFNNELDLLDLHFQELAEKVDGVVLVETRKTFTGADKPLHFLENASRFARYDKKIKHVVPPPLLLRSPYPFLAESHQRNSALLGLAGEARDNDLVIIADCDEIIKFDSIKDFDKDYASPRLWQYHFYLNLKRIGGAYPELTYSPKPVVCTYEVFRNFSPHELRVALGPERAKRNGVWIDNGGWHFSYIGGEEFIVDKLRSFSHQELDLTRYTPDHWREALRRLREGQPTNLINVTDWIAVEIDDSFPEALRNNREIYAKYTVEPSAAALSRALDEVQRKYEQAIGIRRRV
jgi:glycosyl transferase family 17